MPAISGSAALLTLCCFCSTMLSVAYPFLSQMTLRKKSINFGLNEDVLSIWRKGMVFVLLSQRVCQPFSDPSLNFPMIESPQTLWTVIGQQFYLNLDNTFFCIHAIKASSDGFRFSIQYENTREPVVADPDEVRWMLQNSSIYTRLLYDYGTV
ncbi:hypothetical protein BKA82DRAFT_4009501 [Pisolithus tinctorius]|nr:hypothetical protein BKA82DRAFT_4009501 [Pisolithus tinctorius]